MWLNTMHWFNIIANMDEHKDVRRQKLFQYIGILFIVITIISQVIKWLFIENGNVEDPGYFVKVLGRVAEGYILTLIPILCYMYIYHRLSKNFAMII